MSVLTSMLFLLGWGAPASTGSTPAAPRCDTRTAVATTIETIRADSAGWQGRCVTITGILVGMRLYTDRQALLENTYGFGESVRRSLILYRGHRLRFRTPTRVTITGRVGSCAVENEIVASMQANSPDQIIMTGGYCHTSLETYVVPASARVLSRKPIERLSEAEVPAADRPLIDATPYLPVRESQRAAAVAMAEALWREDELAYVRLAAPNLYAWRQELAGKRQPSALRVQWGEAHGDFVRTARSFRRTVPDFAAFLRRGRAFVERANIGAEPDAYMPLLYCWCTSGDCAGKWPVRVADADNDPRRPYFCVMSERFELGLGRGEVPYVTVSGAGERFVEPAQAPLVPEAR